MGRHPVPHRYPAAECPNGLRQMIAVSLVGVAGIECTTPPANPRMDQLVPCQRGFPTVGEDRIESVFDILGPFRRRKLIGRSGAARGEGMTRYRWSHLGLHLRRHDAALRHRSHRIDRNRLKHLTSRWQRADGTSAPRCIVSSRQGGPNDQRKSQPGHRCDLPAGRRSTARIHRCRPSAPRT
jgi:hypothetical protein